MFPAELAMLRPMTASTPPALPLAGVRVIEFCQVASGPFCGMLLADFGADVVKVERPEGDSLRNMAWRDPRDGTGMWWKLVNRNKRTVALDLKDPDSAEAHAVRTS